MQKSEEKNEITDKSKEEVKEKSKGSKKIKLNLNEEDVKKNFKNVNSKVKKESKEFRKFIAKGNVMDLAVGVILGGAFSKIVTSLVDDIIMPLIGIIIGGIDFSNLSIDVLDAKVKYGSFIQQVIDFLIIALCIYFFVKIVNKLTKKEEPKKEEEPKKSDEVILLEEIRDLLKNENKVKKDN